MSFFKRLFNKIKREYMWKMHGGVGYASFIGVIVGENCRIFTKKFGKEPYLIQIGDNVTITNNVVILTHDGSTSLFKDEKGRRYIYKRVIIGNNVFVGVNSIIMPGVVIQDNVIIGAGSVVTKSVPTGVIVAGNPAKIIGSFAEYKNKALADFPSESDFLRSGTLKTKVQDLANEVLPKKMMSEQRKIDL